MDANGARELQRRIEQHRHWQQARAVRSGDQPASDPDLERLSELADGVRLYDSEHVAAVIDERRVTIVRTFAKKLVDGAWQTTILERIEAT